MWLLGSTKKNIASGYVRGANGQMKPERIINKQKINKKLYLMATAQCTSMLHIPIF